jgi:ABC-type sugar transport system ATPase subunit
LARVELRGVAKVYPGGIEAVRPLDLVIDEGALFVIVGPSGSGKTTLLRLIAGLEPLTAGMVWIGSQRAERLAPNGRELAMVFQTPVVYPFMSVFDNLAFGLRAQRAARAQIEHNVNETAALLGLADLLHRRPGTLSGGQRQRVALGRALVRRPRILLLDEPFASLDAPLRVALRTALAELQRRLGTTMIHVTHDQAEALMLGTRIAVLKEGAIVQSGTPGDVYDHPVSRFVGEFIGSPPMNIVRCVVESTGPGTPAQLRIAGSPDATARPGSLDEGAPWAAPLRQRGPGPVDLGIRAEHMRVRSEAEETGLIVRGEVHRLEPFGAEPLASISVGAQLLTLRLPGRAHIAVGSQVEVVLGAAGIVWFEPRTGKTIE